MNNKKAQLQNITTIILGLILVVGLVAGGTIAWGIVKIGADEIIPEINSIGEIAPGINISEHTERVLTPVSILIDNLGLIMGLLYIVGIIGILGYAYIFRESVNGWVIFLFVIAVLLIVVSAIAVSNMYEEFYLTQDDLGEVLRSESLASYLIIYSPTILSIVAFIAGIILFTGKEEPF